jgi:hypothetical protein
VAIGQQHFIGRFGENSLNATAQVLARIANENADALMRQVLDATEDATG